VKLGVVVALACIGCGRLRFELHDDAGGDGSSGTLLDATPVTLACNTPTLGVPAQGTVVSVASTPSGLVASWVTPVGNVAALALALPAADTVQPIRRHRVRRVARR
jgi:hypothetical protein